MFRIGNVQGIVKYLVVCALTLTSECQAAINKDDNIYYFTTRRPFWEDFTVRPTYAQKFSSSSSTDVEDITIFFVVFSLSVVFIALLAYLCQKSSNSSSSSGSSGGRSNYRVPGAVVHPPPRHLGPSTTTPTAPPSDRSSRNPMTVSFVNTGYQTDSSTVNIARSGDVPPDYSAVTIGDLTTPERSKFPTVIPRIETPPPKYQDGQPFSP